MHWREHIARYGKQWFPGEPWVRTTFLALFALAALLRFWGIQDLSYTHDELSALVRIYPTLGETIQRGVIELDTHPPGVQVFEWAWTKVFGMGEGVVKLPFIVLALAALFLLYRFALACTSAPTALVVTALLATLQYTVLYAQIARPYAFGFFTTALLADQLTRYLAFGTRRNWVGTGVAIVLCAYTHHFTLLLAGIMVLSGFFLLRKEQRRGYIRMCAVAALLYLPNIPIFWKQLSMGGLDGWLQPPDPDWLLEYGAWILHFSWILGGTVGFVLLLALVMRIKNGASPSPAQWILPLWGLAPLVIGYGYSIWRSPVLQYSMLIFSFPFVLMALFAGLRNLDRRWTLVICAGLVGASTYSLLVEREHYQMFQGSRYEAMVQTAIRTVKESGADRTLVLFDAAAPQVQFYLDRAGQEGLDLQFVQLRGNVTPGALDSLLRLTKSGKVVLGISNGAEPEDLARVQVHFPYVVERQDHLEGQVYVLTDDSTEARIHDRTLIAEATPARHWGGVWDIHDDLPVRHDATKRSTYWELSGREFGVAVQIPFAPGFHVQDEFDAVLELEQPPGRTSVSVVVGFNKGDLTLFTRGGHLDTFTGSERVLLCASASPGWAMPGVRPDRVTAYLMNGSLGPLRVKRLRLYRRSGNWNGNALFEPVHKGH
ncbi:MAG: glycosyltransferase family 39 protein [Flavobacteriales bacterium]|nr:glycosyltransferase family 39 protein [Flavobacteriales bacterium]